MNIDEDFVAKVKAGEFKGVSPKIKITDIPELSNDKLLAEIRKVGYFYFTQDSLGINVIVPNTRGENGQFEVKYQDISNSIKTENKVWKDIFH